MTLRMKHDAGAVASVGVDPQDRLLAMVPVIMNRADSLPRRRATRVRAPRRHRRSRRGRSACRREWLLRATPRRDDAAGQEACAASLDLTQLSALEAHSGSSWPGCGGTIDAFFCGEVDTYVTILTVIFALLAEVGIGSERTVRDGGGCGYSPICPSTNSA